MTDFQTIKEEITTLIKSSNLEKATKRLIDLANDFSDNQDVKNETIIIRANFVEIRSERNRYGKINAKDKDLLMVQMLNLMTDLEKEVEQEALRTITKPSQYEKTQETTNQRTFQKVTTERINNKKLILEGRGITKDYGHFKLEPIDIALKSGEITGIVGKNGSGKSTLLKILVGETKADEGVINYPQIDTRDWVKIKRYLCYIPQELWIARRQVSVKDELIYWFATHGIKGSKNTALVKEVLYRLDLQKYTDISPNELSGGYKLRFELAKVFGLRPELIILDEPLANLDVNAQVNFLEDIRNLADSAKYKSTIMVSSQHLEEIESISDNIIFVDNGKPLFNGPISELGSDRKMNTVELEVNLDQNTLIDYLQELHLDITVEKRNMHFVLTIPLSVDLSDLMTHLYSKDVTVNYYRDISRSTKKIFESLSLK